MSENIDVLVWFYMDMVFNTPQSINHKHHSLKWSNNEITVFAMPPKVDLMYNYLLTFVHKHYISRDTRENKEYNIIRYQSVIIKIHVLFI